MVNVNPIDSETRNSTRELAPKNNYCYCRTQNRDLIRNKGGSQEVIVGVESLIYSSPRYKMVGYPRSSAEYLED